MADVTGGMTEGGAAGFRFERIGDTVEGVVLSVRAQQDQDFASKQPVTWPDGRPKMVVIFELQTAIRDSDEDDGVRSVWCRANIHTAVSDALRAAFKPGKPSDDAVIGGTLKIRFNATAPSTKGNARKLFIAKFTRGQAVAVNDENNPAPVDW